MQSRVKYVFVRGTANGIRRAWAQFQKNTSKDCPKEPHLIPAMGGCFVALQEDSMGLTDWSALRWFSSTPEIPHSNAASGTLESFTRFLRGNGWSPVTS